MPVASSKEIDVSSSQYLCQLDEIRNLFGTTLRCFSIQNFSSHPVTHLNKKVAYVKSLNENEEFYNWK